MQSRPPPFFDGNGSGGETMVLVIDTKGSPIPLVPKDSHPSIRQEKPHQRLPAFVVAARRIPKALAKLLDSITIRVLPYRCIGGEPILQRGPQRPAEPFGLRSFKARLRPPPQDRLREHPVHSATKRLLDPAMRVERFR